MARVTAMVVKLDNGKYRSIELSKVKAIYTDPKYRCAGTVQSGQAGMGPEKDTPDWKPEMPAETSTSSATRGGNGTEDNGDDPVCYVVNGVIVCM